MTIEAAAKRGVNNYYGSRSVDEARASEQWVGGATFTAEFAFHADDYGKVSAVIPRGAIITSATMEVLVATSMTGTSPTLNVGTATSAATNGVYKAGSTIAGVYKLTQRGSWAGTAPLAADTTVAVELGGTNPTLTTGHVVVKVNYVVAGK